MRETDRRVAGLRQAVNDHPLVALAVCYVMVRMLLVARVLVWHHPDTKSYVKPPSFTGNAVRPWLVPLVQWALSDRGVVFLQAAVSGLAFVACAAALASRIRDSRVRWALIVVVMAVGLAPRLTVWDVTMTSESLGVSTTLLLIACLARLDKVPVWLFGLAFMAWVFCRDGHMYLGVLVVVGLAAWAAGSRCWRYVVVAGVILAWCVAAAANNREVEGYNVLVNVAWNVAPDPHRLSWFVDRGMPVPDGLTSPVFEDREAAGANDAAFTTWTQGAGSGVYARFLATHPTFAVSALKYLVVTGGWSDESVLDHPRVAAWREPRGIEWAWPHEATRRSAIIALFGLAGGVAALLLGERRRVVLPGLLWLSTIPHAILVVHATPIEYARHGLVLAVVLLVSSFTLVAVAADALVSRRVRRWVVADLDATGGTTTGDLTGATTAATAAGVSGACRTGSGYGTRTAAAGATSAGRSTIRHPASSARVGGGVPDGAAAAVDTGPVRA